jgi:hypothetical protein
MLPHERKFPEECQAARKKTLKIIMQTIDKWGV